MASTPINQTFGALIDDKKVRDHSFASLDMMRGLSAFAVLLQHTDSVVATGSPVLSFFSFGAFAVDVFMLISGFLMMWHYYERSAIGERWREPKTILKFYIRRFFRIAPLYYFLLITTYLLNGPLSSLAHQNFLDLHQIIRPAPNDPTCSQPTFWNFLSHFTFTFGFIPQFAASSAMPDWSIGLEMQFYLFFPFIALFLVRSYFLGAVVVLLLAKAITYHFIAVGVYAEPKTLGLFPFPTLLPFKIDIFIIGMLLAAGIYDRKHSAKRAFLFLLALTVAGLYMRKFLVVTSLFLLYELATEFDTGIPVINKVVKLSEAFVSNRVFRFMANASYAVYLIHLALLTLVTHLLAQSSGFVRLSPMPRFGVTLLVITPAVYLLAHLAFRFIESPGIVAGRAIVKSLESRSVRS